MTSSSIEIDDSVETPSLKDVMTALQVEIDRSGKINSRNALAACSSTSCAYTVSGRHNFYADQN